MFNVRPAQSPHHLERPRLRELLPDQAGFVVWLEAPYGYGKSILASQWALDLEAGGWRVVWLSLAEREARAAIAQRLELPASAPWDVLLDELWRRPTLLVLEELDGSEDLQPLLKNVGGLLLLASRQHLPYAALAQLATTDRLTHLTADMLAFTADEALALFGDEERAARALGDTKGWPLPLHFASLAEAFPARATLLEGVRSSVSERAWRELLFNAALDGLPKSAASEATHELVKVGFLQELADAYRLHPLVGGGALERHRAAVHAELDAGADRLPPQLRAAAYERSGHLEALSDLLTSPANGGLHTLHPGDYLRWDELAPGPESPRRRAFVCEALLLLNRYDEALPDVDRLLGEGSLSLGERVSLTATAATALANAKRFEQCAPYAARLRGLQPLDDPLLLGRALGSLCQVEYMQGRYAEAYSLSRQVLAAYSRLDPGPLRKQMEDRARGSMHLLGWELHGLIEEAQADYLAMLEAGGLDQGANVVYRQNAAVNMVIMGDIQSAGRLLREALDFAAPYHRLMIEAMLAFVEGDLDDFPRLLAAARRWEQLELSERVSALWLRTLRFSGDLETGGRMKEIVQNGPYTDLELLWVAEAAGQRGEALDLLERTRGAYPYREYRIHWLAAHFMLTGDEASLDELLSVVKFSYDPDRILRFAGLELAHLPRHRPELACNYELQDVLASGWTEAIEARLAEIPPLEVRLHGEFSAKVMGHELHLTERQQQLLALLVLGLGREAIGEAMWPETDVARQRNNLAVHLNQLRKALEPWGVTTFLHKEGLRNFHSDHAELVEAIRSGDADAVLATFREPLFVGLDLEALSDAGFQLRAQAVTVLVEAGLSGSADSALDCLRRVVELEPLHEEAVQALLERLLARGRGHEARQVYRRFAALLREELGLSPQPATASLVGAP